MINTHYLELPMSRMYFHGTKSVGTIEVLLNNVKQCLLRVKQSRQWQNMMFIEVSPVSKLGMVKYEINWCFMGVKVGNG